MTVLVPVSLSFAIHDDGTWKCLSGWSPIILITAATLATADGRRIILRGDEFEIRCTNGGAVYALTPLPDARDVLQGRLLRSWEA